MDRNHSDKMSTNESLDNRPLPITYKYPELMTYLASLGYGRSESYGIVDFADRGRLSNLIIDSNDNLFHVTCRFEPGMLAHEYIVTPV